ncbi:hypothetical protein V5799_029212 [Amblyomma americanum]|uniref:SCP domain-containing protein n=1 Tax=Amblyomma americanum TaxID=6943 RepID=A0AAQ4ESF9_AMBAM
MAKSAAIIPFLTAAVIWMYLGSMRLQSSCRPEYKKRPTHTACKPPSSWCQVLTAGVPQADRDEILKLHNQYRSQVAQGRLEGYPAATDMQELLWDDELAEVAQAHANLCRHQDEFLEHDEMEDRFTTQFEYTGQNLAWSGQTEPVKAANWTFAISWWFAEYNDYSPKDVAKYVITRHKDTGHFTQVIWASTRYVGCGYVYYTYSRAAIPHNRKYTCNYGPGGNTVTRPVYQEGATCSACPGTTRCFGSTGLCDCAHCDDGTAGAPFPYFFILVVTALVLVVAGCVFVYRRVGPPGSGADAPPAEPAAADTTVQ